MESFANIILNNAQTVRDGGLISSIFQNVKLLNNSNIKKDIMPYVLSSRMTGGYVAALFFGILWILALISAMMYVFYLHFKRTNSTVNRKPKRRQFLPMKNFFTKGDKNSFSSVYSFQIVIIVIFVIPIFLLLCFCLTNVNQIRHSIGESAQSYNANSTAKPTAILPALKKSLYHVRNYLSTFADNARLNTASTVDEIIQATKDMQKETQKDFNKKLMTRLGVENTFKYGQEMTNIVVKFFDISNALLNNQTKYMDVIQELYPRVMNPTFRLFDFIEGIRNSFKQLPYCNEGCKQFEIFFNQPFAEVEGFPDTSFATSFLFVMKQQNKTRESVIAQTQHGRREMNKTMAKTEAKMKLLLDIDGTVRNMTGETWTKMEEKFVKVVELIDNITMKLNSENISNKASRYSGLLLAVLFIPIFLGIVVLFFALSVAISLQVWPEKRPHSVLQYGMYLSLIFLALIMLVCTLMFLYGGKVETELCRYLRTNQPIVFTHNDTRLILDEHINKFLQINLPKIASSMPKSEFPLPKPRNVLYGLIKKCQKNEPILAAINAIESLDTASLSKPEVAAKFIRVGRQLLIESLNETDPKKMLPPDMKDSLQQASQLGMFKAIDVEESIRKVPRTPIFITTNNGKEPMAITTFMDNVNKYVSHYVININDPTIKENLKRNQEKMMLLFEQFNLITDRVRNIFSNMKYIPSIKPVVQSLGESLEKMLLILNNKTELFRIGNEYFDNIIVKSTPQKSAGIMAKFGPKMMSKLGHCRPIFEAYQSSIDTTCDIIVMKLNAYWLYLGAVGLLLTCFLLIVFLMLNWSGPDSSEPYEADKEQEVNLAKSLIKEKELETSKV